MNHRRQCVKITLAASRRSFKRWSAALVRRRVWVRVPPPAPFFLFSSPVPGDGNAGKKKGTKTSSLFSPPKSSKEDLVENPFSEDFLLLHVYLIELFERIGFLIRGEIIWDKRKTEHPRLLPRFLPSRCFSGKFLSEDQP